MTQYTFGTYIVRVWLEPTAKVGQTWRASILDNTTKERRFFSDPESLIVFLESLLGTSKGPDSVTPRET